jgi:imidazolonepropionase-like amidohydrolase
MLRTLFVSSLLFCVTMAVAVAGDEVPGARQRQPIALTNATVHTASGSTLTKATVVFDNGIITDVGVGAPVPPNTRVIDCKGAHVYPGFIAPMSTLGLVEIEAVRATRDMAEVGPFNPNARAETAYNPDSDIIPTVRSNGVLLANVAPQGGTVSGQASLMRLDGWTREDIAIRRVSGLVLAWPSMDVSTAWWVRTSAEEQKKQIEENVRSVYRTFEEARAYSVAARAKVDTTKRDIRFEAMRGVFEDSVPVFIEASSRRQIEAALAFMEHFGVRIVLVGAQDADLVVPQLQRAGVGVIIPRVHSLPSRDEDEYDRPFALPRVLAEAKIPFAFSDNGAWQQRNLPFHAGTARAFGLSEDDAIRGLTLWPARILGVEASYGSIEKGKSATLFVSTGDALDSRANNVVAAFIDGRELDLTNRHKRLAKKYRERSKQ